MELIIFLGLVIVIGIIVFSLYYFFFLKNTPAKEDESKIVFPENPALYTQENMWKALNMQLVKLHQIGELSEATKIAEEALNSAIQTFGSDHIQVAILLNNLAAFYKSQGKLADAERLYKNALEIMEKRLGKNHPDVASCLNNLADLYFSFNQYDLAEELYSRAVSIYEKKLPKNHPNFVTVLENLLTLYKKTNRNDKVDILNEIIKKHKENI